MDWSEMASITLEAVGDSIAFSRNGVVIETLNGVYRNKQELKRSKNSRLRLIDCDVVTVPYSPLIKSGDDVFTGISNHKVAGDPVRDSSGGMIVMLSSEDMKDFDGGMFDR